MGVIFVSYDWMKTLSTWQWIGAFLTILAPFTLLSIGYGRWSAAQRKSFDEAAAARR